MTRYDVINAILGLRTSPTYLEIGLAVGENWFRVKAPRKIGVDPRNVFTSTKVRWHRKILFELSRWRGGHFYSMTSDTFFAGPATTLFRDRKIDVAFIDGWHSYEQALKDVVGSLSYLAPDGVIVLHDCNPQSAAATAETPEEALRLSNHTSGWNGDVWKTIVHLRSLQPNVTACVLDCDEGLGLVRFGRPSHMLSFSAADIAALAYDDLSERRKELLDLRSPNELPRLMPESDEALEDLPTQSAV